MAKFAFWAFSEVELPLYGVLKLDLGADSYNWTFVSIAGQTFTDSGSGSCHWPSQGNRHDDDSDEADNNDDD